MLNILSGTPGLTPVTFAQKKPVSLVLRGRAIKEGICPKNVKLAFSRCGFACSSDFLSIPRLAAVEVKVRSFSASPRLPWQSLHRIYCINLDRRPERWKYMQRQFTQLQMPAMRWSAVDGRTLDVSHLVNVGIVAHGGFLRYLLPDDKKLFGMDLTDGGIGCALSHMQIWRNVIQQIAEGSANSESKFLVLEDDCAFIEHFSEELLNERLSHVPSDWELVYLGGQDLLGQANSHIVRLGVIRLYKGFRETTAYIINEAGAKACLEACVPMFWQFDTHLNDMAAREGLRSPRADDTDCTTKPRGYFLWPPIVSQERLYPTDVQKVEHD